RDVIEYEMIACDALFTLASRYRERFVRNHLWLGEEAIRKGRDEPPYAWLVPPDQSDPGAAAHMLEILHATGIDAHQAKATFTADGVAYPAGTYVLLAAQPFRPHLKDMMERQEYPNRAQYPGGPPEGPYDMAGWTLPLQMGVRSVAVVSPFEADLTEATAFESYKTALNADRASGFYVTKRTGNYDYAAVNALLDADADVRVLIEAQGDLPAGSIAVTASDPEAWRTVWAALAASSAKAPIRFDHIDALSAKTVSLVKPRTALYQPWTASMDEGWTRLVLERFEFPYETLHNAEIRAGKLRDRFDCIIIPDLRLKSLLDGHDDTVMPPPYAGGIGKDGAMALERFVEQGGTLVLMDSATRLATDLLRVPVKDALAGVASKDFFCPGSIVRLRVDNGHPLGFGFGDEAAGFFARSQAFVTGKAALEPEKAAAKDKKDGAAAALTDAEIEAKLEAQPVTTVVSYSDNIVLLSGWIHGADRLRNRAAVCEVAYGKGRIVLLGFRVQHRAQPWGTFKFLFNAIYWSGMGQ
ncbi:MAG: peptidase M14, partial [Planctomycetes bacterium]|nr:peptidase M14 [Planctomycetota bacterium]